jgi:hypothetical protein
MRVTMTSAAARTGHANEDFTGAAPTAAVLIDGAGISGTESICRHGVAWYASRLGGSLISLLSLVPDRSLSALLAEAIKQVTDAHRDTCDVADPISPSATVAMLRCPTDSSSTWCSVTRSSCSTEQTVRRSSSPIPGR